MSDSRCFSEAESSLCTLVVADLRAQLLDSDQLENQAHAKRVLAAHHWAKAIIRTQDMRGVPRERAEHLAVSEVAVALTCSTTIAGKYIDLGTALESYLPLTRIAFRSGHLDHRRVEAIWRATRGVEADTIARIEPQIIAAAHRMPPGKLATEIERLLIEVDPARAGRRRRMAAGDRRVTMRCGAFGMAWLEAHITAEEALAIESMIEETAATVCRRDPRDKQQRRADAFVALLYGEQFLACRCDDDNCPAVRQTSATSRRKPYIFVHVDLATLLALADNPAVMAGHGPIAPEIARMLAQDATWQPFIQEGKRLAEHWIAENGFPEPMPQPTDTDTDSDTDTDTESGDTDDSDLADEDSDDSGDSDDYDPEWEGFVERSYAEYLSRTSAATADPPPTQSPPATESPQRVHSSGSRPPTAALGTPARFARPCRAPRIPHGTMLFSHGRRLGPVYGDGAIYAAIDAALAADSALALGVSPNGHGGLDTPPPGALTYRPDAATARNVRARDGHCRHPGCTAAARRCEIDHIVPFDHHDPRRGGWTIESNLHCLCKRHHDLKTWGLWRVVVLAGFAELWTSATGQRALSLPAGYRSALFVPDTITHPPDPAGTIERPPHLRHAGPQPHASPPDDAPPPF